MTLTQPPAWAADPGNPNPGQPPTKYLLAIFRNTGFGSWLPPANCASAGDVIVATTVTVHGVDNGYANILWTSPVTDVAK